MEAFAVDWRMNDRATTLVDWRAAYAVGRRLSGDGPSLDAVGRATLREQMAAAVETCDSIVSSFTGLHPEGSRSSAWVMTRDEWIDSNLHSLERVMEPLLARTLGGGRAKADWRNKALGAQLGALFGYVSRKVLGQYDAFLPADDSGLIYFVAPNVVEVERRFALQPRSFRTWIAMHEVTHRIQFASAPWLRGHLTSMIDSYLATVELDPKRIAENLRRAVQDMRDGGEGRSTGILFALMTAEQREVFHRTQALMSLLEGHATFVMNGIGPGHVDDLDRMKRVLQQRRRVTGVERAFQQTIGFATKLRQYQIGERFVAGVVERGGMEALNTAFAGPENLPNLEEIADPASWISRVSAG